MKVRIQQQIERNPWTSFTIAIAAGFVLRLGSRRRTLDYMKQRGQTSSRRSFEPHARKLNAIRDLGVGAVVNAGRGVINALAAKTREKPY